MSLPIFVLNRASTQNIPLQQWDNLKKLIDYEM